jgi:hypothetical protein
MTVYYKTPTGGRGLNAHPLSAGLIAAFVPVGSGATQGDRVTGERARYTLTGLTPRLTPWGDGVDIQDAGDSIALSPIISIPAGSDWTSVVVGIADDVASSGGGNRGLWRAGSAANGTTFNVLQSGTGRPWLRVNGTDVLKPTSGTAYPAGVPFVAATVFRSGASASWFLNGRLEQTATTSAATAAFTLEKLGWQFSSIATNTFDGAIAAMLFWNRVLSAAEIAQLSTDPFVMFRRRGRLLPLLVGSAACPPSSNPPGVGLTQSAAAAFPDRPAAGGRGLRVTMGIGGDGAYLERDLGADVPLLHTRVLLNPGSAAHGAVAVLRGLSNAGAETFRLKFNPVAATITLVLATGQAIGGSLAAGWPWHCVEMKIDAAGGAVELWINGVSAGAIGGSLGALATRTLWLGAPFKDRCTCGEFDLDEWAIADGYIGPVRPDPVGVFADNPARWLVVYNTASADSMAWALDYRQKRAIRFSNLLGLALPLTEQVSEAQFDALRTAISDYVARNFPAGRIIGVLLGHGVPGLFTYGSQTETVAGQLHLNSASRIPMGNPLVVLDDAEPMRPEFANLGGFLLTARIDGPMLADSMAVAQRANTLDSNGLADGDEATIWLDPYKAPSVASSTRIGQMAAWAGGLDRQRLRLPLRVSSDTPTDSNVSFSTINHDGFFWGWDQASVPTGFFGSPAGQRVFCFQLSYDNATCPTLRSAAGSSWAITALQAGYAATAGTSRAISPSSVPLIRPFFESLRLGWSLAEAWFVACPFLGDGLMLVGDPLMTVAMPRGGWNLYGPFDSWPNADLEEPIAAPRESERAVQVGEALRPADGARAIYVLRHADALGREEAGVRHTRIQRVGDSLRGDPWAPAWPAAPDWTPRQRDGAWEIGAAWGARAGALGIAYADLVEQPLGHAEQVVMTTAMPAGDAAVQWARTPSLQPARFKVRARGTDGGFADSPWSGWVELEGDAVASLTAL